MFNVDKALFYSLAINDPTKTTPPFSNSFASGKYTQAMDFVVSGMA